MPNEIVEVHVIFSGRVQGVGFRATVQWIAAELGVKGTVCNLPNGTVEVFVQTDQMTFDTLMKRIKERFPHAEIAFKEVMPLTHHYQSFQIIF